MRRGEYWYWNGSIGWLGWLVLGFQQSAQCVLYAFVIRLSGLEVSREVSLVGNAVLRIPHVKDSVIEGVELNGLEVVV